MLKPIENQKVNFSKNCAAESLAIYEIFLDTTKYLTTLLHGLNLKKRSNKYNL